MAEKKKEGFAQRLRYLRGIYDLTQGELAEKLGIRSAAISKYENGGNNYPTAKGLVKLADFFGVSIDYLLRGKDADVVENTGVILGDSYTQANVQANNGGVVINGRIASPEALELLRIYEKLKGRERLELLRIAFELENKSGEEVKAV